MTLTSLPPYEKLPQNKKDLIDEFLPFITAAFAGCTATMIIQPIDLLKVQIQIKNEMRTKFSIKGIISEIIRTKGYRGFYIGFKAIIIF